MAYTFGGATSNDINLTAAQTMLAGGRVILVAGWWLPTTLTNLRGLWSAGNTAGCAVNSTTSQVRLKTDNTTDGQWTCPVGLVVGQWQFLAFLCSTNNTGPAASWKVWSGTGDTAPVEITVTQATAPVGNFTGSTAFTLGNIGTGTVSWQGDIDLVRWYVGSTPLNGIPVTSGAITASETENVYRRIVLPFWEGKHWCDLPVSPYFFNELDDTHEWGEVPLGIQGAAYHRLGRGDVATGWFTLTVNGATISKNRCPRSLPANGLLSTNIFR